MSPGTKQKEAIIKSEGDEFVLYTRDGTRVLGRHKTREDALRQERAIQISKHAAEVIGIPSRSDYGDVSKIPVNKLLQYVDQLHKARRAGPHHDIRFGDKELFSWATRKSMPGPGGKVTLFQQPVHSPEYAGFQGEIPEGYGAGVVSTGEKGTVLVTEATPDKIKFVMAHRKYPEYFTMIRQQGKGKPWLLINHTPTEPGKVLGNTNLFSKVHIKSVPAERVDEFLNGVVEGKIDGASGLFKLKKDSVDVLSYRIGTNGRPIIHTERFFGGKAPKLNIPKEWQNKVLRGEIYSTGKGGKPQSAQQTTPLLNMSLAKSIQAQKDTGQRLRAALFGIADGDFNAPDRESKLHDALTFLPKEYFGRPPVARTPQEARRLWSEIAAGKHPETDEGVVVYPETGAPLKIKLRPEYDVNITGVFPGEGKYTGSAGGIEYGADGNTGRVGTGFDDAFRNWLWQNKESLPGRVARITSTKKLPSGKYYQPSFLGLHEDYPTKPTEDMNKVSFLPKLSKEEKPGLWANIRNKRERGGHPAKPGDKSYPDAEQWRALTQKKANKLVSFLPYKVAKSPAWQRSEGKNSEGGLNAKGRASYNKATGGHLRAPVTEKNPSGKREKRQNSFCSRMCGMKKHRTGSETKNDPNSRINKALRKWRCHCN